MGTIAISFEKRYDNSGSTFKRLSDPRATQMGGLSAFKCDNVLISSCCAFAQSTQLMPVQFQGRGCCPSIIGNTRNQQQHHHHPPLCQSPIGQLVRTHPPLAPLPDPPPFPLRMEHRLNGEIWAFCKTPEQYPPLSDQEPQQITKTSSTVITRIRARSPHESSTNSNQLSNAPAANSSAPLPQRITSHLGKVGQHRNWWIAYFHPRRMIEWIIGFNENA